MQAFIIRSRFTYFLIAAAFVALFSAVPNARADSISFGLSASSLTTTSGGTVTFDGTVTNASGADLNASDFFFNFTGFDPVSVIPNQDLGIPDFLIPNGKTSAVVPLFDVTLRTVAPGSIFPVDVQIEDVNNDLSAIQTVDVSVPVVTPAPEPASFLLLGAALVALAAGRKLFTQFNN